MNHQGVAGVDSRSHLLHQCDLVHMSPAEFEARYKVLGTLGSGAYADVLRVRDMTSKTDYALKVLQADVSHPGGLQPDVALFREARALKHAKHRNVVELVNVLRVPQSAAAGLLNAANGTNRCNGSSSSSTKAGARDGFTWVVLMEYLQGGALSRAIYKQMVNPHTRVYTDTAALTWAVDIAAALAHLHSLKPCIIHRDLKLENIMLQKTDSRTAANGRSLPVAKITDFGLHVMLDTPPCPYLIKTVGGCSVLLFGSEQQQQGQQQQETGVASRDIAKVQACSAECCSCGSNNHTKDAFLARTAEMAGAQSNRETSSTAAAAGHEGRASKHVMFSDIVEQKRQQWQQQLRDTRPSSDQEDTAVQAGSSICRSAPSPTSQLQVAGQPPQQQEMHEEDVQPAVPLTIKALRRLSIDAVSNGSLSRTCSSIPIVLQSAHSRPGAVASFCKASISGAALQRLSPSAAALADAAACTASMNGIDSRAGAHGSTVPTVGVDASAAGGAASNDVTDILAAANAERDYVVNVPDVAPSSQGSTSRRPSIGGSSFTVPSSRPRTPRTPSGAANAGDSWPTPRSQRHIESEASDASMSFEEELQAILGTQAYSFDSMGVSLAYDLTQQTGSCMYMAPEIFRGEPYNERVDVFSFGVILYELFSRSLLLYTHTPAKCPEDCMNYAKHVASGFRPQCPKSFHSGVWQIVQRCWDANPNDRPTAAWALQQLQQLLDAEEATAAAAQAAREARQGKVGWGLMKGRKLLKQKNLCPKVFAWEDVAAAATGGRHSTTGATVEDTAHAACAACRDRTEPPSSDDGSVQGNTVAAKPCLTIVHATTAEDTDSIEVVGSCMDGAAACTAVKGHNLAVCTLHAAGRTGPAAAAVSQGILVSSASDSSTAGPTAAKVGNAKAEVVAPDDGVAPAAAVRGEDTHRACAGPPASKHEALCGCVIC